MAMLLRKKMMVMDMGLETDMGMEMGMDMIMVHQLHPVMQNSIMQEEIVMMMTASSRKLSVGVNDLGVTIATLTSI